MAPHTFIFDAYDFDRATGVLTMRYAFGEGVSFSEEIVFPPLPRPLSKAEEDGLEAAIRLLYLLAGVSYYKAFMPPQLVCKAFPLDQATAQFCQTVYHHGLGEFSYQNKIKRDINFVWNEGAIAPQSEKIGLPSRLLVPVGGGKDSIVTIEALKKAGHDITLFALGGDKLAEPIARTIEVAGLPFIHVRRRLSSRLIELNKEGALNGHVPITAILSAIAAVCAIMQGFNSIVLSNENSANAPNVICEGEEINHQYSKSIAFEKDFASILHTNVAQDLAYLSLLRPLTETAIAARFAKLEAYHDAFRSCNTAFKQEAAQRGKHWCCNCPKCRFVFLALAPFIEKEKLCAIFGQNMLNDPKQTDGFRALCGLGAIKPFECVGEIEESRLLILKLAPLPAWRDDAIVQAIAHELAPLEGNAEAGFEQLLVLRSEHCLSTDQLKVLA